MEETKEFKKIKESDSKASYYLGNSFEVGAVRFGPDHHKIKR
jgi:hypothetical protein